MTNEPEVLWRVDDKLEWPAGPMEDAMRKLAFAIDEAGGRIIAEEEAKKNARQD